MWPPNSANNLLVTSDEDDEFLSFLNAEYSSQHIDVLRQKDDTIANLTAQLSTFQLDSVAKNQQIHHLQRQQDETLTLQSQILQKQQLQMKIVDDLHEQLDKVKKENEDLRNNYALVCHFFRETIEVLEGEIKRVGEKVIISKRQVSTPNSNSNSNSNPTPTTQNPPIKEDEITARIVELHSKINDVSLKRQHEEDDATISINHKKNKSYTWYGKTKTTPVSHQYLKDDHVNNNSDNNSNNNSNKTSGKL